MLSVSSVWRLPHQLLTYRMKYFVSDKYYGRFSSVLFTKPLLPALVPLRNVISGESAYQLKMSLPESFRPIRLQLSLSGTDIFSFYFSYVSMFQTIRMADLDDLVSVNEIDAVREVIETYYHEATANHKSLLIGEKVLTDLLQKIILFRLAAIHMSNPTENGNAPVKKLSQLHLLTDAVETG